VKDPDDWADEPTQPITPAVDALGAAGLLDSFTEADVCPQTMEVTVPDGDGHRTVTLVCEHEPDDGHTTHTASYSWIE
jgi:hypothetical protein